MKDFFELLFIFLCFFMALWIILLGVLWVSGCCQ